MPEERDVYDKQAGRRSPRNRPPPRPLPVPQCIIIYLSAPADAPDKRYNPETRRPNSDVIQILFAPDVFIGGVSRAREFSAL